MKKFFLLAVAVFLGISTIEAQSIHPRVEVAGSFSRSSLKISDTKLDGKIKPGFRAGAAVEIALGSSGVFVAPGLTYKTEGSKSVINNLPGLEPVSLNSTIHYLTIPVDLGMRLDLGLLAVSVEAGPYFSYALKGSFDKTIEGAISTVNNQINTFSNDWNLFKRYDIGVGASAAVEFSKFYVRLGTDLGLVNVAGNEYSKLFNDVKKQFESNIKNSNFYVGVGLRF